MTKKISDLTNKQFERLIAIKCVGRNKHGSAVWLCNCSCGNVITLPTGSLTSGNTKSCGCLRKELMDNNNPANRPEIRTKISESRIKLLIGKKFGKLVVVELDHIDKNNVSFWKCLCDCGNEIIINRNHLINRKFPSCGCYAKEKQMTQALNTRSGRLVAIRYEYTRGRLDYWLCQCDCGNTVIVDIGSLRRKETKSCGCYSREVSQNRMTKNNPMKLPENRERMSMENPMKRPEIAARIKGNNNPACRPEVRIKIGNGNRGYKNGNWKDGASFEPYCPKWTPELRERIRAFFNYECILCGKSTEENGKALSCHHVEYNKEACCDGKLVHFAALYNSCHSKTNYNRKYWEYIIHTIIKEIYNDRSYFTKEEYKQIINKEVL